MFDLRKLAQFTEFQNAIVMAETDFLRLEEFVRQLPKEYRELAPQMMVLPIDIVKYEDENDNE